MSAERLTHCARKAWSDALGIDVGADTDFFAAGGDSLSAMRIIGSLDDACEVPIRLRTLFDNPRFEDFVQAVARDDAASAA